MKRLLLYSFLTVVCFARAQDKLYLMDGSRRTVKVLEIAPDNITVVPLSESGAPFVDANEVIPKSEVILIEYKSGLVEIYTVPQKTAVYNSNGIMKRDPKKDAQELSFNFVSINTLALCNADISAFFERLLPTKRLGFGFMAAYNFNSYVTLPNSYIGVLYNAKKNYDVGGFVNFYPGHFRRRTTFYFGALFKYTSFNFDKVVEENTGTAVNVKYEPAKGSQLATIINVGFHSNLGNNFFFKTIAGIGGFRLRGEYKDQFNYLMNKDLKPGEARLSYNVLPKIYLGLNFGFNF